MSNTLPPLEIPSAHRRNNSSHSNISLPPLSSWSDGHSAFSAFSSSPPRSSSPPMTPFSRRSSHNFAYIRSSPGFDAEISHYHSVDHIDELPPTWHLAYKPRQAVPQRSNSRESKSFFLEEGPFLHVSRLDASKNTATHFHERASASTNKTDVVPHYGPVFCDSEEEEEQDDDEEGYSFVEDISARPTFRTSAERGQWRYDPIPFKTQSRAHLRQSAPTSSPPLISGLQLLARPISAPAPSTITRPSTPRQDSESDGDGDNASSDIPSASYPDTWSSDHDQCSPVDVSCSLPSLTSDRESTEPEEEITCPSSPLPPSSPPLSPVSLPVSPVMSPLSLAPSSPHLMASSSLSVVSELDRETEADGEVEDMDLETDGNADTISVHHDDGQPVLPEPKFQNVSATDLERKIEPMEYQDDMATASMTPLANSQVARASVEEPILSTEPYAIAGVTTAESVAVPTPAPTSPESLVSKPDVSTALSSTTPSVDDVEQDKMKAEVVVGVSVIPVSRTLGSMNEDLDQSMDGSVLVAKGKARAEDDEVEALADKNENGVDFEGDMKVKDEKSTSRSMEKRKIQEERTGNGPVRKRSRLAVSEEPMGKPKTKKRTDDVEKKAVRKKGKHRLQTEEEEDQNDEARTAPKAKRQKKSDSVSSSKRARESTSISRSSSSSAFSSNASSSTSKSQALPKSKTDQPVDPETVALDAEIRGMLIESMATSRASCLPASSLLKLVMQCRPALKAQRGEREWSEILERVLWGGEGGVFGKVESSGKDDSDRPLEAQWFYVPELDEDQERATLIKSMMPRPGKRSETKKYKQYYYRPLDKISRWDPEDEM